MDHSQAPVWLQKLISSICDAIEAVVEIGPLVCEWSQSEDHTAHTFHIICYPTSTEVCGGPRDGVRVLSTYRLDLARLLDFFDEVDDVHFDLANQTGEESHGPSIVIKGKIERVSVAFRFLSEPPPDEPPSRFLDYETQTFREA